MHRAIPVLNNYLTFFRFPFPSMPFHWDRTPDPINESTFHPCGFLLSFLIWSSNSLSAFRLRFSFFLLTSWPLLWSLFLRSWSTAALSFARNRISLHSVIHFLPVIVGFVFRASQFYPQFIAPLAWFQCCYHSFLMTISVSPWLVHLIHAESSDDLFLSINCWTLTLSWLVAVEC